MIESNLFSTFILWTYIVETTLGIQKMSHFLYLEILNRNRQLILEVEKFVLKFLNSKISACLL